MVQAVVIVAHFHSLSSFIHGCGITPEIDFDKGHVFIDYRKEGAMLNSPTGVSFAHEDSTGQKNTTTSVPYFAHAAATVAGKPTKSILKKTESSSGGSGGPDGATSVQNNNNNNSISKINAKSASKLLKSANSIEGSELAGSPPKRGYTLSEVETLVATMKNLSETSPIEE